LSGDVSQELGSREYAGGIRGDMATLNVREAVTVDIPAVVELVCSTAASAFGRYGNDASVRRWQENVPTRWKALLSREDALILVAYVDNELVSTAFVEERGSAAYFGGAYSARPGTGAGRELVRRRLCWARSRPGITSVLTDVFADGPSPEFWASLGLSVVGEYLDEVFPGVRMLKLGASITRVRTPA